jgi:hypothetical protein
LYRIYHVCSMVIGYKHIISIFQLHTTAHMLMFITHSLLLTAHMIAIFHYHTTNLTHITYKHMEMSERILPTNIYFFKPPIPIVQHIPIFIVIHEPMSLCNIRTLLQLSTTPRGCFYTWFMYTRVRTLYLMRGYLPSFIEYFPPYR